MIRKGTQQDAETLARLALLLWENPGAEELTAEFAALLKCDEAACFLAYHTDIPVGFAQCQLRHDYVEGTQSSPVGYLEGIFVRSEFRRCGLANGASLKFHLHMGFAEANRIICFTKK